MSERGEETSKQQNSHSRKLTFSDKRIPKPMIYNLKNAKTVAKQLVTITDEGPETEMGVN